MQNALIGIAVFGTIFLALDIGMIVTLLAPGDERKQVIVWKASTYTLLAISGELLLSVAYNFATARAMTINPFVHLEVTAILYFCALLFYKRKHGG